MSEVPLYTEMGRSCGGVLEKGSEVVKEKWRGDAVTSQCVYDPSTSVPTEATRRMKDDTPLVRNLTMYVPTGAPRS